MAPSVVQVLHLDVEQHIRRLDQVSQKGTPISPQTTTFLTAETVSTKHVGEALKIISKLFPLNDNFLHAKRIENRQGQVKILICEYPIKSSKCLTSDENVHELLETLTNVEQSSVQRLKTLLQSSGELRSVPLTPPICAEEVKFWSETFWPVVCVQKNTIPGKWPAFAPEDANSLLSRQSQIHHWLKYVDEISSSHNGVPAGCIVNLRTGCLVSDEFDSCLVDENPLRHAAIKCIDSACNVILNVRKHIEKRGDCDTLNNGMRVSSNERKKRRVPTNNKEHECLNPQELAVSTFFDREKTYLCTGLDYFTSDEPCAMCAMALLHSRIRSVYYLRPSPTNGALGSKLRLHCLSKLNHHYAVFRAPSTKPDVDI